MHYYFLNIRNKILSKGTKVNENMWKLDSCVYESLGNKEKITAPGLVEAVLADTGAVVIVSGSEDALKFLEASI